MTWPDCGAPAGALNGWTCDRCGRTTYAVHVHAGATPMFLTCRFQNDYDYSWLTVSGTEQHGWPPEGHEEYPCMGQAVSIMYPSGSVPQHVLDGVHFEWYRPDWAHRHDQRRIAQRKLDRGKRWRGESPEMLNHLVQGGLKLRDLTDAGRDRLEALVSGSRSATGASPTGFERPVEGYPTGSLRSGPQTGPNTPEGGVR